MTFNGYALLVGVTEYQYDTNLSVPITAADAHAVAAALRDEARCGYPADRVAVLCDKAATREQILGALADIAGRADQQDTVFIFYGGMPARRARGASSATFCLATYDVQYEVTPAGRQAVAGTALDIADLAQALQAIRSERVVLLLNTMQIPGVAAEALLATGAGRAVITACREKQANFIGSGPLTIFAQALVDCLSGQGVASRSGYIGMYDLYAYLYDTVNAEAKRQIDMATRQRYGAEQEPELLVLRDTPPFPVGLFRGATPTAFDAPAELPIATAPAQIDLAAARNALASAKGVAAPAAAEPERQPARANRRGAAVQQNGRAAISAPGAQGVIGQVNGPLNQRFVQTGGGDYAEGALDKRTGMFVGGLSAASGSTLIGSVDNLVIGAPRVDSVPRQVPPVAEHYVPRKEVEKQLHDTLSSADGTPLTVLYGFTANGKSTLAANVVEQLIASAESPFPDGVLWGNLAASAPAIQAQQFLVALGRRDESELREMNQLRSGLWEALREKRILIVLDRVSDAQQVLDLKLPESTQCRMLVISEDSLEAQIASAERIRVGPMTAEESFTLFSNVLGPSQAETYHDDLTAIAQALDHLPQLVKTAAQTLRDSALTPPALRKQLQQRDGQSSVFGSAALENLQLTLKNLQPIENELLELTGVLGEGEWPAAMLSAIALRPMPEVLAALGTLVRRDLVARTPSQRYQTNTLVRQLADQRLLQRDAYAHQAAWHLMARYCLDVAQDLQAELATRPELVDALRPELLDERFVLAFRDRLLPETPRLRRILDWAVQNHAWEIIRRLAYLPYMGLIKRLVSNGPTIRADLSMTTLDEPLISQDGRRLRFAAQSFVGASRIELAHDAQLLYTIFADKQLTEVRPQLTGSAPEGCEIHLNLAAGRIVGGIFADVDLLDPNWVGVRTSDLIFKRADMVSARMIACDLSRSVWLNCDARGADLTGSNMSYAMLRLVKLRGARLERVNFTGAVLIDVDLRNAKLAGANFSGARMQNLNLIGADLDEVNWAAAEGTVVSEPAVSKQIDAATKAPASDALAENPYRWAPDDCATASAEIAQNKLPRADLRAIELAVAPLSSVSLREADLRAANLKQAVLTGADLSGANLRAAALDQATLTNTILAKANLRAATLCDANLDQAQLAGADLSSADLSRATLANADLSGANLYEAVLSGATLASATLVAATLSFADASRADLRGAKLTGADLRGANLAGAQLDRADLAQANCRGACFAQAQVSDDQLASAGLLGGATLPGGEEVVVLECSASGIVQILPAADGQPQRTSVAGEDAWRSLFLHFAELNGNFSHISMTGLDLFGARFDGNFRGADLAGSSLLYANLSRARNLTDEQLRQTARLRGAVLPNGLRYGGALSLAGDLEDARAHGVRTDDVAAMAAFYANEASIAAPPLALD